MYSHLVPSNPASVLPSQFVSLTAVEGLEAVELADREVPGRIHRPEFRKFWKETLEAPKEIVQILEEGYKLPLTEWPPSSDCLTMHQQISQKIGRS